MTTLDHRRTAVIPLAIIVAGLLIGAALYAGAVEIAASLERPYQECVAAAITLASDGQDGPLDPLGVAALKAHCHGARF